MPSPVARQEPVRSTPDSQLESLYAISVEIAGLHQLDTVMDRALDYCLQLTASEFGFVGLIDDPAYLDVAAIKGFQPDRPEFWAHFRRIPIRRTIFGLVVIEGRPNISNDVANDPHRVGAPRGHPPLRTFLGVPLRLRERTIGMIGVANRASGYAADHERLLSTFANQVAVAIENARLYEEQQAMIAALEALHARLDEVELQALIRKERDRIADELHDRVAQLLFGIGMGVTWCLERAEPGEMAQALARVRELAARGGDEIRRAVYDLAAEPGRGRSFADDLRETGAAFDRTSDLQVHQVVDGRPRDLPAAVEEALHRVVIEALTNVQRHSGARVAIVSLRYGQDDVTLVVQDDGRGLPEQVLSGYRVNGAHFGLKSMERRVVAIGGTLHLANSEDGGTLVRVTVPLASAAAGVP
jgi:signal transduction histidine kinase